MRWKVQPVASRSPRRAVTAPHPPPGDSLSAVDGAALPFIAAVAGQLARSADPASPASEERRVAERVVALLRLAGGAPSADAGPERAGELLGGDVVLLAAFFQNVDLLYEHGYDQADAVSLAIMHALSLLES